ncbi:hypothetical protein MPTK1_4g20080 [Marchantia polymorpha subsp. ruderalis]|uniref:Uncharacterized protein n=2 Tax=Marchantia polymorpha TaxID=3197 RepID=A0AAF6BBV0_MARPO|nr:hypothetical protein MARPO_0116s0010 [Marchantia polymorpha]BBN09484.1 hypothetical protein Mp_4g20080 [Marchantia polymorpha subsp. ruderalis]|eukprot:PTQ31020.1 hypothetical protein MARPO_0116s0010 [Marchantia polymorpha]
MPISRFLTRKAAVDHHVGGGSQFREESHPRPLPRETELSISRLPSGHSGNLENKGHGAPRSGDWWAHAKMLVAGLLSAPEPIIGVMPSSAQLTSPSNRAREMILLKGAVDVHVDELLGEDQTSMNEWLNSGSREGKGRVGKGRKGERKKPEP